MPNMKRRLIVSILRALLFILMTESVFAQTLITQWKLANFTSAQLMAGQGADDADPNGDGTSNLLAYAFALTPQQTANAFLPQQSLAGGRLRLSYLRVPAATDLSYVPEVSSDLRTWTTDTAVLSVTPQSGGTERVVVEDVISGAARRFIRLRVNRLIFDTNNDGLLDDWQLHYFGSVAGTGNGAPLANPSGDGFANVEKGAVDVNPLTPAAANSAAVLGLTLWTELH
jgi:hypothetical protein